MAWYRDAFVIGIRKLRNRTPSNSYVKCCGIHRALDGLAGRHVLKIKYKVPPVNGVVSYHEDAAVEERICTFTCNGLEGISDF
jgi:hypothetical protein